MSVCTHGPHICMQIMQYWWICKLQLHLWHWSAQASRPQCTHEHLASSLALSWCRCRKWQMHSAVALTPCSYLCVWSETPKLPEACPRTGRLLARDGDHSSAYWLVFDRVAAKEHTTAASYRAHSVFCCHSVYLILWSDQAFRQQKSTPR